LPVSTEGGDIKIVRVGIKKTAIRGDGRVTGGTFTPAQLRLICKRRGSGDDRLGGEAVNVYPIGHLKTAEEIQVGPEIKLESQKISGSEQFIDFVFNVPSGYEPVLVQYKMNSIVEIPPGAIVTDSTKIPEPALFNTSSGGDGNRNRGNRNRNRPSGPAQQQSQTQAPANREPGLSDTSRSIVGTDFDEK
jgi:hypothetical protein